MAWLARLPDAIRGLEQRWHLTVGERFGDEEGECAWVAPATGDDGSAAVLKLGMPHMESDHEIAALRFWNGDPSVRLLEADDELGAMLLERCEPGSPLRALPEPEQDAVLAQLLPRLWRAPPPGHPFRPLSTLIDVWAGETLEDAARWPDAGLVRAGLQAFKELSHGDAPAVLLATDLHAGNVLRAEREPWLVIDPKPFVGDPAFDATQHLLNCEARMRADPLTTIGRFSALLGVDPGRTRRWMFARLAAGPRVEWTTDAWADIARAIAPWHD